MHLEEGNPWSVVGTRRVYENPWIRVREDRVLGPTGRPGIYGVVEFRNLALGMVPLFDNGDTLLVGQYRYPLGAYSWEIPEGGGDPSLDPQDEAARELEEETGLRASSWTHLGTVHTSNSATDEVGAVYLAEGLTQHSSQPEDTEVLALRRLPFADAVQMAVDGALTDSLTVVGLCRAAHHIARRARGVS